MSHQQATMGHHGYRVQTLPPAAPGGRTTHRVVNSSGRHVGDVWHATREAAQQDADRRNITALMDARGDDGRPREQRYAEAETTYRYQTAPVHYPPVEVTSNVDGSRTWRDDAVAPVGTDSEGFARQRVLCVCGLYSEMLRVEEAAALLAEHRLRHGGLA